MLKRLDRKNIFLIIFLAIITYGIYMPIWFLNRVEAINNLSSKKKIKKGPIMFVLVLFIASAVLLIPYILYPDPDLPYF